VHELLAAHPSVVSKAEGRIYIAGVGELLWTLIAQRRALHASPEREEAQATFGHKITHLAAR